MSNGLLIPRRSGRGWAYTGALLGGLVSIAANVAHSYVPPAKTPDGNPLVGDALANWAPEPGAVFSAVIWPVFLFVAIEILARYDWPAGRRWIALRFGGLVPVAVVAAVVSYRHLSGLLAHYGEDSITVAFGPLAVDGLMVMATGALIATGRAAARTVPAADAGAGGITEEMPPPPATVPTEPAPGTDVPALEAAPARPARPRPREVRAGTKPDTADLLLVGQAVAADLHAKGEALTRAALIDGVRSRGRRISTTRATELLHQLRSTAA